MFIEAKVNGEPVEIVNNQLRFIPTEAGKYTFVITLSDAAGNKSICNRIITVTEADVTAPRLEVNSIPTLLYWDSRLKSLHRRQTIAVLYILLRLLTVQK